MKKQITITITENSGFYAVSASDTVLGRQWDHNATEIVVIKPVGFHEKTRLTMEVYKFDRIYPGNTLSINDDDDLIYEGLRGIDSIEVLEENIPIPNYISQYENIRLKFIFRCAYKSIHKNTESLNFTFLQSEKPVNQITPNSVHFIDTDVLKLRTDENTKVALGEDGGLYYKDVNLKYTKLAPADYDATTEDIILRQYLPNPSLTLQVGSYLSNSNTTARGYYSNKVPQLEKKHFNTISITTRSYYGNVSTTYAGEFFFEDYCTSSGKIIKMLRTILNTPEGKITLKLFRNFSPRELDSGSMDYENEGFFCHLQGEGIGLSYYVERVNIELTKAPLAFCVGKKIKIIPKVKVNYSDSFTICFEYQYLFHNKGMQIPISGRNSIGSLSVNTPINIFEAVKDSVDYLFVNFVLVQGTAECIGDKYQIILEILDPIANMYDQLVTISSASVKHIDLFKVI